MQPLKQRAHALRLLADRGHCVFSASDLAAAVPECGHWGGAARASREEILADKVVALALRENRVNNRDLWDIAWLVQQGVELPLRLIPLKIRDHRRQKAAFIAALETRLAALRERPEMRADFMKEMRRFLPAAVVRDTIDKEPYWRYLTEVVTDHGRKALVALQTPA